MSTPAPRQERKRLATVALSGEFHHTPLLAHRSTAYQATPSTRKAMTTLLLLGQVLGFPPIRGRDWGGGTTDALYEGRATPAGVIASVSSIPTGHGNEDRPGPHFPSRALTDPQSHHRHTAASQPEHRRHPDTATAPSPPHRQRARGRWLAQPRWAPIWAQIWAKRAPPQHLRLRRSTDNAGAATPPPTGRAGLTSPRRTAADRGPPSPSRGPHAPSAPWVE
jgi:hypothetical protein